MGNRKARYRNICTAYRGGESGTGTLEPGSEECKKSGTATTDEEGKWMVRLPSQEPAAESEMWIMGGEECIHYTDVRIGEVWIDGGQSNMEYYLAQDAERDRVLKDNRQGIMFFDYPEVSYERLQKIFQEFIYAAALMRAWNGISIRNPKER